MQRQSRPSACGRKNALPKHCGIRKKATKWPTLSVPLSNASRPPPALRYCLLIKPVPTLWGTWQPRSGCAMGESFCRTPHFGRRPRKALIFHPQPKNVWVFAFHSPRRFAEVAAAVRVARQQPTMGSRCASDYLSRLTIPCEQLIRASGYSVRIANQRD